MLAAVFSECHPFRSSRARERYLAHYDAWAKEWPIPSNTRSVTTSQGNTFVRISGPSTAPPLVLLPPTRASSLGWMLTIAALSEHYRTYAVDNICDIGRSANSRPIDSRLDAMEWLDELLDELGLREGVSMMGASFGGWMAAEYALHEPARLAATVWLSPPGMVVRPSAGVYVHMVSAAVPTRFALTRSLRWIMPVASRSEGRTGEFFDRIVEDGVLAGQCYRFLPLLGGGPRLFADTELRSISVPALYVVGEHERLCPPYEAVARLNAVAPHIETALIPGADHSLIVSRPEEVVRVVLDFLGAERGLTESASSRLGAARLDSGRERTAAPRS